MARARTSAMPARAWASAPCPSSTSQRASRAAAAAILSAVLALVVLTDGAAADPGPAKAVSRLVDEARARKGCPPLRLHPRLAAAAQRHASDMARRHYFAHDTLRGPRWYERIRTGGFRRPYVGENIGYGQTSPGEVVRAWLASPSHRRNILDCRFAFAGVGFAAAGPFWVQDFGGA